MVGLPRFLGEVDAFGAFAEGPGEFGVFGDVLEEEFPLDFEGVIAFAGIDDVPVRVVVDGAVDIGIPHGAGGVF